MIKNIEKILLLGTGIAILALASCSTTSSRSAYASEPQETYGGLISNDYSASNTEALAKEFPVMNPTSFDNQLEKDIQNRLLTGFANWNRGFDAWKAWGNILYVPESIYNVHGARLTLKEYQDAMNISLKQTNILMGDFLNMMVIDNWVAIQYNTTMINNKTGAESASRVMEFVNFKDFGPGLGVRVDEGWGGRKDDSFLGMSYFQTPEERANQAKYYSDMLAYQVPADGFEIKHPTNNTGKNKDKIEAAVLNDFKLFNESYVNWADHLAGYMTADCRIVDNMSVISVNDYMARFADSSVERLYFDNLMVKGDWAALHYRTRITDPATGAVTDGDCMEFLHFKNVDGQMMVDVAYI